MAQNGQKGAKRGQKWGQNGSKWLKMGQRGKFREIFLSVKYIIVS